MNTKKQINIWFLVALIVVLSCSLCAADEIIFNSKGAKQIGTVVEENQQGVTVFFPRKSVKSIIRSKEEGPIPSAGRVIMEDNGAYITVKIPRRRLEASSNGVQVTLLPAGRQPSPQAAPPSSRGNPVQVASQPPAGEPPAADNQLKEKVDRLEKEVRGLEKAGPATGARASYKALLQEEMGGVKGVILWNGKPIRDARVKVVMDTYTGFSLAALRMAFSKGNDTKSSGPVAVALDTKTDSNGHYSFSKVPPGSYTLYWQPSPQIGWVRRLRENADFEIAPGKVIVVNIPGEKKPI